VYESLILLTPLGELLPIIINFKNFVKRKVELTDFLVNFLSALKSLNPSSINIKKGLNEEPHVSKYF